MKPTSLADVHAAEKTAPETNDVALNTKILYSIGEISNSIRSYTNGVFLLFFYTSVMGLSGTLVGMATSIGLIWDAAVDPLIGHFSDRAQFRLGRRHTFMLVGAIGMGLSFFAVFDPPPGLSQGMLLGWLVISSIVLRTSSSLFMVPYHALGAELSHNYRERTQITGIRAAAALGGTLLAGGLSISLFFPNRIPGVDPKLNPSGYLLMGIAFGLLMMVVALVAFFATLNQRARLDTIHTVAEADRFSFVEGMVLAFRRPAFMVLTIGSALFFLASVVNATLTLFYMQHYAKITASNQLTLFQLAFPVGALCSVGIWIWLARRIDKHYLYILSCLLTALMMSAAFFLIGEGHLFGTGNVLPLVVGNAIAGFFASGMWVIPGSMIADVVDHDELLTGQRREGTFFGINSFLTQIGGGIALLIAGTLVDNYARLIPNQAVQSPATVQRLAIIFGPIPAAFLVLAALGVLIGYRLSRQQVYAIQRQLAERRVQKGPNTYANPTNV